MKITGIKTFMGLFSGRNRALIKVETDEGIHGWGEAYSIGPDLSIEPIADYIFEMMKGEDPRRIEYIMLKLTQQFRFPPGGTGLAVSSAGDHALWDISGMAAGLPVYMLLGGKFRDRVEVYTHFGGATPEDSAAMATRLVGEGYTALKSGARSNSNYRFDQYREDGQPQQTAAHFAAVREAVGPGTSSC